MTKNKEFNKYIISAQIRTKIANKIYLNEPNKAINLLCDGSTYLLKASKIALESAKNTNHLNND